jgi:hypothetical protein
LREFPHQFDSLEITKYGARGAGGVHFMPAYQLPQAQPHLCGSTATLKNIYVQTRELGVEPQHHVFSFGSPGVFGMQRWFGLGHAPSQPVSRRLSASISRFHPQGTTS